MKPILVELQLTFLINNFDPGVNKVSTIKGAAEEGSFGIFKLKPYRFFCPLNKIKLLFFNLFILISALMKVNRFSVWFLEIIFSSTVVIPGVFSAASKIADFTWADPIVSRCFWAS